MSELKQPLPRGLAFKVLDQILYDRYLAVKNNPNLKIINRWDLSDCFYKTRKKLDALGYDVGPLNDEKTGKRKVLYSHVKDWCDRMGLKRHDIGIFAADRAVMAFQGELHSVSFENYKQLAHLGVDIVLVEKEGIVAKLVPFTTDFGIAFIQSEGFVSEYGQMLAQEAKKKAVNLIILTDFDSSGITLAHKIDGAIRLGIHLGVLDEFNRQRDDNGNPFEKLDPRKLRESYNGGDHWTYLRYLSKGAVRSDTNHKLYWIYKQHDKDYQNFLNTTYMSSDGFDMKYIEFIKYYRIELNTIMDEVESERFWNWLKDKLIETFPTRDYNRAITVPDYVLTDTMLEFNYRLKQKLIKTLDSSIYNIRDAYQQTTGGFLSIDKSLKYTNEYLKNVLEYNDSINEIDSDLKAILEKMD